ncbi:MAG TPA: 6-bladed beta-propeller [Gemmatimonadales bacterium]|nr:6-bladed beta-propeller [Gemmatimonadales bacterium]
MGRLQGSNAVLRILAVWALASCGPDRGEENVPAAGGEPVTLQEFLSAFRLVDSIELEQSAQAPIVRVSGLALSRDGRLALADASESNVKLFDPAGRLLLTMGRNGSGPAEFQQPRFPRFGADGRLFVGDGQLNRITEFDSAGAFRRTIELDGMTPLMGLALGPRNEFYLTGPGRGGRLVHLADTSGKTTGGFLLADQARPVQQPDSPLWRMLSQQWLAGAGTLLYVASTLSDTLWELDPATGTSRSFRVQVPGYVQPRLPQAPPRGIAEITAWQKSFHIAGTLLASPDLLVMPFVRGVLNYGDPMVLMVRPAGGGWLAFRGAPPPVLVSGDSILAILHPGESERVVLGVFRRSTP